MVEIGRNIKKRRIQMGITLRGLAQNINISPSFISQVESGKVSPSLSSLTMIADALNTTVGALVDENSSQDSTLVVRKEERKSISDEDDDLKIDFLGYFHPDRLMEPLIFTFTKKSKLHKHRYKHFGQEFVLVLEGCIEVALKEKRYTLHSGDSIYFNSGVPHAFWSACDGETTVISVNSPPNF